MEEEAKHESGSEGQVGVDPCEALKQRGQHEQSTEVWKNKTCRRCLQN